MGSSGSANTPGRNYLVNGSVLSFSPDVRDLGVTFDSNLTFVKHISLITHKALTRAKLILKCFRSRNRDVLTKAFCVYVRPLLEYCTPLWSPSYKYLIERIESVQRFFTKSLHSLFTTAYADRLRILKLETLERRRLIYDLVLCFKYFHDLINFNLGKYLTISCTRTTRKNVFNLEMFLCRTNSRRFYFVNRAAKVWNSLPSHVVECSTLRSFKNLLCNVNFNNFLIFKL